MSRPAMSRHLRVLRRAGLVAQEALRGRRAGPRLFRLQPSPLSGCGHGWRTSRRCRADQLEAFKVHAERVHRSRRR